MTKKRTKNPAAPVRSRTPNGVVKEKPIAVRLMPDELTLVDEVAHKENRTAASVLRLAALRGLAEYKKDPQALTNFASL